jgi:hypothetical protein
MRDSLSIYGRRTAGIWQWGCATSSPDTSAGAITPPSILGTASPNPWLVIKRLAAPEPPKPAVKYLKLRSETGWSSRLAHSTATPHRISNSSAWETPTSEDKCEGRGGDRLTARRAYYSPNKLENPGNAPDARRAIVPVPVALWVCSDELEIVDYCGCESAVGWAQLGKDADLGQQLPDPTD